MMFQTNSSRRGLLVAVLLCLLSSGCAQQPRCHTHQTINGPLTECDG